MDAVKLFEQGFCPAPGEDEKTFLERVSFYESLSKKEIEKLFPAAKGALSQDGPFPWLWVFRSGKGLTPWQAAAVWTVAHKKSGFPVPLLQVRGKPKEEVIAHESVHILRAAFQEERFEEIIAFRYAKNKFRRFVSPIFRKTIDIWVFLTSLALFLALSPFAYFLGLTLPLLVLLFYGLRLYQDQLIFSAALANFEGKLSLMTLLTDDEIAAAARGKSPPPSLRQRLLLHLGQKIQK